MPAFGQALRSWWMGGFDVFVANAQAVKKLRFSSVEEGFFTEGRFVTRVLSKRPSIFPPSASSVPLWFNKSTAIVYI